MTQLRKVETSENNGQAGPTTGVELSFDFADTTSDDGAITKSFWILMTVQLPSKRTLQTMQWYLTLG